MAVVKSNFSSQFNGFRFVNRFEFDFPDLPIPFVGKVKPNDVVYGLCGGMCFSALDYFYAQEQLPEASQIDELDTGLFTYLVDRQLDSLTIPVLLRVIRWMVSDDRYIGLRMTRYELPKLRRRLDKGDPSVLALIRVKGLGDPTQNHQVLATGYEYDPSTKRMLVNLYDPNHPGKEPTLTMDLNRPSQGIHISQSTGEALRGFFLINYLPQTTVPRLATSIFSFDAGLSFDAAGKFNLRWPVDSHRVNQYFGENPNTYKPFGLPGHEGLDLYAPSGANIYAAADGEVYQVAQPKGHPYGLQIRIKHEFEGKVYHTIYAHLAETAVKNGHKVRAGELIGRADNTGNSFGSHLHLTLKVEGEKTKGYPDGIVDPWPYLKDMDLQPSPPPMPEPPAEPLPDPSGITVYTTAQLNLRAQPTTDAMVRAALPAGESLSVLGEAGQVRDRIGKEGEWLQVQTASGLPGYVAAWYVQDLKQALPPSDLVVYPNGQLNLRTGPATVYDLLASLNTTDSLTVLGNAANARSKIGQAGQWLQVQTEAGVRGFVAAWLVHATGQALPASDLEVYPTVVLNVRARPVVDANLLTVASPTDALTVLGEAESARARIGQQDQWLEVRTPEGYQGYVAAWFVRPGGAGTPAPTPPPPDSQLMVFPTADLNIRAQASLNSPRVGGAFANDALEVIDADLDSARSRVGKQDEWLRVKTKDGARGWAAAWFLKL
ncbi:MAG TPA: SH3 domain-containing protein [Anaerolineales bacterium]